MKLADRVKRWRPTLAAALLLGALACGDTQCDCAAPLDAPLAASEVMPDALEARLTPRAFGLLEDSLPGLLGSLVPGGLAFQVPPMHQDLDAVLFSLSVDICAYGCTLVADLGQASLARVEPDRLRLTALVDLSGTLDLSGDVECEVPILIRDKPVSADVVFVVDARSGLLSFDLQGLQISLTDEDYELDCRGQLGELVEAMKAFLTQMMNEQIGGQIDAALGGMLAQATCLGCGFYARGCPAGSTCQDGLCRDADGVCLTNPLGLVGRVDLGLLLGDALPGFGAELELMLALGQERPPAEDPVVREDGLNLRLLAGVDVQPSDCVPEPDPAQIPPVAPPPRLEFLPDGTVPGSGQAYMLGLAISDAFLDRALYKAYRGGMLCLGLDSGLSEMLSSGTLALLMGSLDTLTHGKNAPVRIVLRPGGVPGAVVGAGTFTVDGQGNKILDDPLLTLALPEVSLDFFVRLEERWLRVVTLTQDVSVLLGLEFLPDNRVLPVFDERSIVLGPVTASNHELLAEDPAALENLLPTLLGLALPMLTESLGVIDLPEVQGFLLDILAVRGETPKPEGEPGFEHLALYADLALAGAPAPAPRSTRARLASLEVPARAAMSIRAPGGPVWPEARVWVEAGEGPRAEYSWRLDGGGWSVFRPGPQLLIRSPLLLLGGEHRLEVRARTAGDYRSLDLDPAVVPLVIDPPRVARPGPGLALPVGSLDGLAPSGGERLADLVDMPGPGLRDTSGGSGAGCGTSGGGGGGLALALFLAALARRRR